jgi:hypothetical protein
MVDQGIANQECIATHTYTNEKNVINEKPLRSVKPIKDSPKKEVTRGILWK